MSFRWSSERTLKGLLEAVGHAVQLLCSPEAQATSSGIITCSELYSPLPFGGLFVSQYNLWHWLRATKI